MAIHRRVRQAPTLDMAHDRRAGKALQRRHARRRLPRGSEEPGLDVRLEPLAAHVLAGNHYECAWELFRFGHFKGLTEEHAAAALAAWAQPHGIEIRFDVRMVRWLEVIFVLLTAR